MRKIFLMIAPVIFFAITFHPLNSHTVNGKITDNNGSPVKGASVIVKGGSQGVSSSQDGTYKIVLADKNATLMFSALGYQSQEIKVNGRIVVDVILTAAKTQVQEVVVVGKRKELAGSVAYLKNSNAPMMSTVPGYDMSPSRPYFQKTDEEYIDFNTEGYDHITENRFLKATDNPLSTFSIDVDAASYSNIRRFLNSGQLPPAGAVRVEEMINYFRYDYPAPKDAQPFSVNTEISGCPWNADHKLVLIGLQGKKIPTENLPSSNLVFLIDVSGSMQDPMKLPLVKASMKMLVDQLRDKDKVAIVVYAGNAGLVLSPTSGDDKSRIKDAIDRLEAGGSTAGGEGIKLAYKTAKESLIKGGNNRVILCTDGDFNIGASSDDEMERLIEEERKSGVFLTVLGYGMGNYKDGKMQKLADKGNGNHAYIDGLSEAKKVLVSEFGGTLFTIAKDVKLQIEFNPAKVEGYRLIGYENRLLNKEDFKNDKKDAGELGSGHTVTALYEVIPAGVKSPFLENVDSLRYQKNNVVTKHALNSPEIMTIKFRYKAPDEDVSKLIEHPVIGNRVSIQNTSDNFRFAASVAEFGMLLRNSEFKSTASFDDVLALSQKAKGNDEEGYRSEFIRMVGNAKSLTNGNGKTVNDNIKKSVR